MEACTYPEISLFIAALSRIGFLGVHTKPDAAEAEIDAMMDVYLAFKQNSSIEVRSDSTDMSSRFIHMYVANYFRQRVSVQLIDGGIIDIWEELFSHAFSCHLYIQLIGPWKMWL